LAKTVGFTDLPCNFLQSLENNLDPIHVEFLHMKFLNWVRAQRGEGPVTIRKHARIDFELFEFGIRKKRLWEGVSEDSDEWRVGHPMLFPCNQALSVTPTNVELQFRLPVDDERTIIYWYNTNELESGQEPSGRVPLVDNGWQGPDGGYILEGIQGADMMAWVTQGPITDHSLEHLGESDKGVALLRKTLLEQIDRVERGEDPMGIRRDPATNTPFIKLDMERHFAYELTGVPNNATELFPFREVIGVVSE
jgi:5,5'-dehydrodivanillate O-demethylase oxygenase subunit